MEDVQEYGLGRIQFMTPESHKYNAAMLLDVMPKKYRRNPWPYSRILNQHKSGICTAAMLRGLYEGRPLPHKESLGPDAPSLYRKIVLRDNFPENDYEADPVRAPQLEDLKSGSTIDAAMLVGRDLGWWPEFRWIRSVEEADEWVRRQDGSPLGIGINWYQGFFRPDDGGIIRLTGSRVGGHAIRVRWHDPKRGLWLLANSWGPEWGVRGECYMDDETFNRVVFQEQGECAVAIERPVPVA